jgi:4-amino-4-deoxy-L-arabinose transferase-like glycosyltransferase
MSPSGKDAESKQGPERRPTVPPIPGFAPRAEDRFAHLFRRIPAAWLILGAGVISTGIYLLFVLAFPLTRWWNHPHTADNPDAINDLGRITGYSPVAALAFVAALLILFSCQFAVLQGVSRLPQEGSTRGRARALRRAVFLFPVLFGAIMVWMQSITTTDLYGYVARGYLYAQLHQNPMITKAILLPGGLSVDRPPSPYGPAWILVTGLVSEVAGNSLLLNLLLFKLIGFAGVLVAIWLVDYLARRLYPERRLRIVVLFSWCPLLFFDSIGNGHNDIIMMVCVLAAFALMLNERARTAFAFLVVGALIKYVSAILIPLWLVYELRSRLRPTIAPAENAAHVSPPVEPTIGESGEEATLRERSRDLVIEWVRDAATTVREIDPKAAFSLLISAGLIGLLLIVACYAPFWAGINTFTGLGQQLRPLYYNSSIVGFISAPLQLLVPASKDEALDKTLRLIFYTLFFVYAYLQTQRLWVLGKQATMRDVITASAKVTFAALLLITFWFQPWYVVWVLPLAALAEAPFVRRQGLILAAGALMTYSVANFLLVGDTNLVQGFFVQFFEIIIAFGPLLLLRASPSYDQGWVSIVRRYAGLIGKVFAQRPVFWERLMVLLVLVVAILLRLVRLDNLFVSAPLSSEEGSILRQASSDLRLYASDPQGLQGPFVAAQGILVHIFGETAFAVLLPSAIIGSITVLVIYLMTSEIMHRGGLSSNRTIAILAALLAATSQWHVSLSRSGMEVVILPLLMCTAMYWLLIALRKSAPSPTVPQGAAPAQRRPALRAHPRIRGRERLSPSRLRRQVSRDVDHFAAGGEVPLARTISIPALFYYIGCGICTGLACDLEPGLWLVPLIIAGLLIVWHWRMPKGFQVSRTGLIWLVVSALVAGSPVVWHYLSNVVGFPKGSSLLARSSVAASLHPVLSQPFWVQAADNFGGALNLLISQDYTAGYPSAGGASIIPVLLGPFFFLGLLALLIRWRSFESLVLVLLIALPPVASVAVGTPTSVIEAASVLPALCIVPALGLYEIVSRLGHLPIVLDRINGVRVFSTPEQIGRILLLGFLLFSTVRTFFWYFEASLPPHQNQYNASWIGSPVVYEDQESTPGTIAVLRSTTNGANSAGKSVVISQNGRGPCPLPKSRSVSTE